jgi:predicted DNA-binding antitoxin AbrB/MazE fold protein
MTVAHSVRAVYEGGWLKPLAPLPLPDRQRVELLVTALPDESHYRIDRQRVQQLHEKANAWLAQQPAAAVREPQRFSPAEQARLDAEFDQLLTEMQATIGADDEAELAALVDEAVAAVRAPHS